MQIRRALTIVAGLAATVAAVPRLHAQTGPAAAPGHTVARGLAGDLAETLRLASEALHDSTPSGHHPVPDLLAAIERVQADVLLMRAHQADLEAHLKERAPSGTVLDRQAQAATTFEEEFRRLEPLLEAVARAAAETDVGPAALRTALQALVEHLRRTVSPPDRTPLGVTLPFRSLNLPQKAPELPAPIVAAYQQATFRDPGPADVSAGPEVPLDAEMLAQARALNQNPIAIYEFVRDQVDVEFYHGAMKGARETLRQKSGNDVDQASLLIALMRASGIPARYVRGVIALPGAQAMAWTGVGSTRRAAEVFTRAGIPFRPVMRGGTLDSFEVEHTWVEVAAPYANYRGARLDVSGRTWLALDASIKAYQFSPGVDIAAAAGLDADALVSDYLRAPQALAPIDFLKKKLTDYLAEHRPDVSYEQALGAWTRQAQRPGLLPNTLPYATVTVNEETAALPDTLRHRVRFVAQGESAVSFDVTLAASELVGRRLTISYVPATVDDQIAVNSFLSLDATPAYLVRLRPVLKVGGVVRAAGEEAVQMGALHGLTLEVQAPRGSTSISNQLLAGGYFAVALDGSLAAAGGAPHPEDTEPPAAERLYRQAADYLQGWDDADRELGSLLRVVRVRPTLSVVMVGTVYNRTVLFGLPQAIDWRGVFVDADLRANDPVAVAAEDGRGAAFMRLSGLAGSVLEGDVLQRNLEVDAVSAARLLQLARADGIPVDEIDATNLDEALPQLQTAEVVKTEIADAVAQGFRVTVPRQDFTHNVWTGIGYVVLDPATGSAGYFISGGLAGGMSTVDPSQWVQQQYAQELGHPYTDPPNADPMAAASIRKVASTDGQEGKVGQPLSEPLAVWVRDANGKPVAGATVTFSILAGGGDFDGAKTRVVISDSLGIARVKPTMGKKTQVAPFYVLAHPGDKYATQVGENVITATVTGTLGQRFLPVPFQVFAHPGEPHHIVKVLGEGSKASTGTWAGTILARLEDSFDNPLANEPLEFKVLPAQPQNPEAGTMPASAVNVVIYRSDPPCANPMPLLGDCNGTSQLTVDTSLSGASVEAILGNTGETKYQVQVRAPARPTIATQVFALFSLGVRRFDEKYVTAALGMTRRNLVTDKGTLLNSAPVGQPFREPLEALLYVIEDEYEIVPTGAPCPNLEDPCYRIKSLGTNRLRAVDHMKPGQITYQGGPPGPATVNKVSETVAASFKVLAGGGTTGSVNNPGSGRHNSTLTVGPKPDRNVVEVSANVAIWVPCFDLHWGSVTPKLLRLHPGERHANPEACGHFGVPPAADGDADKPEYEVFGVQATIEDRVVEVARSPDDPTSHTTLTEVPLAYLIEPAGYTADSAEVDLFAANPTGGADEWLGFVIGNQNAGPGVARLFRGTALDPARSHSTQLVLNRGSVVEVKSGKARLTVSEHGVLKASVDRPVKTRVDRLTGHMCDEASTLTVELSTPAEVTITVDGAILSVASPAGTVTYDKLPLPAGRHTATIGIVQVPSTGEHPFKVSATFTPVGLPPKTQDVTGTIVHSIVMTEFLPVGHTLVEGVDLHSGHLALSRDDLSIPGVGPTLQFTRSYGSAGSDASGPMGAGWTHNYNSTLTQDSCGGFLVLSGGEGSGVRFSHPVPDVDDQGNPVTRYRPQAGYHGSLIYQPSNGTHDYFTKERLRYHYEPARPGAGSTWRLAFVEDPHGNRLTLNYDVQPPHNLLSVTDASGRRLDFTYAPFGTAAEPRIVRVDGPLGLQLRYGYDPYGNLVEATRDVRTEIYAYSHTEPSDRHNLRRVTDPNGNHTEYTYYAESDSLPGAPAGMDRLCPDPVVCPEKSDLVKTSTKGAGTPVAATHGFVYDYTTHATKVVTTVTDPRLIPRQYTMNPRGNVVETRVPTANGDNVTLMRWAFEDGIDDVYVTQTTDPNGRVTNFTYDANGNQTSTTTLLAGLPYAPVTDAGGAVVSSVTTTTNYDPKFSKPTLQVDAEGNATTFDVDPVTGVVRSTSSDPKDGSGLIVTKYDYGPHGGLKGLVLSVTDPRGNVTQHQQYDQYGNATRTVDAKGNLTQNVYDARGRLLDSRDSFGRHVVYQYDELDRIVSATTSATTQPADPTMSSPDQVVTTTYKPGGERETVTDGLGHVTTFEYDALNRVARKRHSMRDADGHPVLLEATYEYDGNGNKERESDLRQVVHEFKYDELNRPTERRTAGQMVARYTYDMAGNVMSEEDLHGHVTAMQYDGLYRKVKTVLPLAPYTLTTTYDRVGTVLRTTDANNHETVLAYDGVYRLRSKTSASPVAVTVHYRYDHAGNRIREENTATGLVVRYAPYDELNRPTEVFQEFTDPLTGQPVSYRTAYSYDDAAHTRETINPRQSVTRERYNGQGLLIERTVDTATLNLMTTYQYDANGNLAAVKDPEGSVLGYTYDGLGKKIRTKFPLGGTERFFYDGNGNLVRAVDKRDIATRHEYDALNRLVSSFLTESITNGGAERQMSHTVYDDAHNVVTTTDARRNDTVREYDALHREIKVTDALDRAARTEWDGVNRVAVVDRLGSRTEFVYDAINRLVETRERDQSGAVRATMTARYVDAQGQLVETDRGGIETVTQLDALQRMRTVSRRHPGLQTIYGSSTVRVEQRDYDGNGNVVRVTDANGNRTDYRFDGADRRVEVVEGAGSPVAAITTYTFDGVSSIVTVKDGRSHGGAFDVRYTYDARHRKTRVENVLAAATVYTYDQNDKVETITEPKGAGHVTTFSYDELGRLIAVDATRGGAGGITRYLYDPNGNLIAQQDAGGSLTTYGYDALDRRTDMFQHTVPGRLSAASGAPGGDEATARHWRHEYDAEGNETLLVDAEGQQVQKSYDYRGRLARKDYGVHKAGADGSPVFPQWLSIAYTYDDNDNVVRTDEVKKPEAARTATEVCSMAYDPLDRLIEKTNYDGKVVRHTYDRQGNRTSVVDADGIATLYSFDARNRLASVDAEMGGGRAITGYAYWPDGLQRSVVYPNGTRAEMTYDAADRLVELVNAGGTPPAPISRHAYTYDNNGNPLTATETRPHWGAAEQITYGYDALNRLQSAAYPNATITYAYSASGNRLTETGHSPATTAPIHREYRYDALNQVTVVRDLADPNASAVFRYDANGNTVEQRTGLFDPASGGIAAPLQVRSFAYDIRDALAAADHVDGGRVLFDYDYTGRRVKKVSPFADTRYLYDQAAVLQEYDGRNLLTLQKYNYGTRLLSLVTPGAGRRDSLFYLFDGRRSVSELTDETGALKASYAYDAWGGLRQSFDLTSNRRRFTGQYFDTETGLHYLNARYYDDKTGRFLTHDPFPGDLATPPSLHRYAYAYNNPLTYSDPEGELPTLITGAIGAVIGGVAGCVVGAIRAEEGQGLAGCGKGAVVGGIAGGLAGLTLGVSLAATGAAGMGFTASGTLAGGIVGTTSGSLAISGALAGAVGGSVGMGLGVVAGYSADAGDMVKNVLDPEFRAKHGDEILAYAGMGAFLGAVGGATGGLAAESLAASGAGTLATEVGSTVIGDVASQTAGIALGAQDSFDVLQLGVGVAAARAYGKMAESGFAQRAGRFFSKENVPMAPDQFWRATNPRDPSGFEMLPMHGDLPMQPLGRVVRGMTVRELFLGRTPVAEPSVKVYRGMTLTEQQAQAMVRQGFLESNARRGGEGRAPVSDLQAESAFLADARAHLDSIHSQTRKDPRTMTSQQLMQAHHSGAGGPDSPGISFSTDQTVAEGAAFWNMGGGRRPYLVEADTAPGRGVPDVTPSSEAEITFIHEVRPYRIRMYELLYGTVSGKRVITGRRYLGGFNRK